MIKRCKARHDGLQCTLLDSHKTREVNPLKSHTFVRNMQGFRLRFHVQTVIGETPIHEDLQ